MKGVGRSWLNPDRNAILSPYGRFIIPAKQTRVKHVNKPELWFVVFGLVLGPAADENAHLITNDN